MTEKEMRDLDVWIAENAFGIEVKWDADGAPYSADGVIGGTIIAWIRHYSSKPEPFSAVKREIERRDWSWGTACFTLTHHADSRHSFWVWDGDLEELYSEARAGTEELAGCLALKEALSDGNSES